MYIYFLNWQVDIAAYVDGQELTSADLLTCRKGQESISSLLCIKSMV